jgi:hypothetical protein
MWVVGVQLVRSQGHNLTARMSKSLSAHHLDRSLAMLRYAPPPLDSLRTHIHRDTQKQPPDCVLCVLCGVGIRRVVA